MVSVLVFIAFIFLLVPAIKNMYSFFNKAFSLEKRKSKTILLKFDKVSKKIKELRSMKENTCLGFEDDGYLATIDAQAYEFKKDYNNIINAGSDKLILEANVVYELALISIIERLEKIEEKIINQKIESLKNTSSFLIKKSNHC